MYQTFASNMNKRQDPNGFYLVVLFILIKTFCHLFLSHDPNLRIFHNLFIAIRQEKPFCTKVVGSFLTPHLRNFFLSKGVEWGQLSDNFFFAFFPCLWFTLTARRAARRANKGLSACIPIKFTKLYQKPQLCFRSFESFFKLPRAIACIWPTFSVIATLATTGTCLCKATNPLPICFVFRKSDGARKWLVNIF